MSSRKPTESALRTPAKNVQLSKTLTGRKDPASDGNSPSPAPRSAPKFVPHSAAMKISGSATTSATKSTLAVGTGSRKPTKAPDSSIPKSVLNPAKNTPVRVGMGPDKSATGKNSTKAPQLKTATSGATPRKARGLAIPASSSASTFWAPLDAKTPVSKSGIDISTQTDDTPITYFPTSSSDVQADNQQPLSPIPSPVTSQSADQSASQSTVQCTTQFAGPSTSQSAVYQPSLTVSGGPRMNVMGKQKLLEELKAAANHLHEIERIKESLVASRDAARQDLEKVNKKVDALSLEVKNRQDDLAKMSAGDEQHEAKMRALKIEARLASTSAEKARIADERLRSVTIKRPYPLIKMMDLEDKQKELKAEKARLQRKLQDYHEVQRQLEEVTLLIDEQKLNNEKLDREFQMDG